MTVEEWLGKDNTLGIDIWKKKYQYEGETFDHWLDRISGGDDNVKNLIVNKKFLFGGRILSNRGTDFRTERNSYSNCYVLPRVPDSIEGIYDTCKQMARTYSYGGGVGIDISNMAPSGARVRNQAKSTSGAVSFMDTFSQVTGQIGQANRRGALMISISCDHPDVEEFITIKSDLNKVNFANISVRVTDDFMKAVQDNKDWELHFERPETGEIIKKTVNAGDLFNLICKQNWDYAEPGVLFWDNIQNYNLLNNNPEFGYAGTNPCAEEPLPPFGACLLGSLNLSEFVDNKNNKFDYSSFENAVELAVKALNDVLDEGIPRHPLKEQQECARDWRQIGLGIMGLADCLIKLGIRYGSPEAIELCDKIGQTMATVAIQASSALALKNGAYPKFNDLVYNSQFYTAHVNLEYPLPFTPLRNSQLLTIAPTGTLSTMLGISGGIEPIFANSYTRTTKSLHNKDVTYKVYTPIVQKYMEAHNLTEEAQLPDYFVTSGTISVDERINMQSIWQKHIDASISSTVNLPHEATVEDVCDIYMKAWKQGLKGITVFREGCARISILTSTTEIEREEKDNSSTSSELKRGMIIRADDNCIGKKRTLHTGCGTLHCEAFFDPETGDLLETYLSKGSSGGCNNFMIGLSRMISLSARGGIDIDSIVDQLKSSGTCPSYAVRAATMHDTSKGSCCPVAIGNALIDMHDEIMSEISDEDYTQSKPVKITKKVTISEKPKCPNCGGNLVFEGGCNTCKDCGWSKCD